MENHTFRQLQESRNGVTCLRNAATNEKAEQHYEESIKQIDGAYLALIEATASNERTKPSAHELLELTQLELESLAYKCQSREAVKLFKKLDRMIDNCGELLSNAIVSEDDYCEKNNIPHTFI